MYVSCVSGLYLTQFISALAVHCPTIHTQPCNGSNNLINIGRIVLEQGYIILSEAFKLASPGVKYTAEHGRRKILQLPLVAIRIGNPERGHLFSVLMERFSAIDYSE